MRGEEVRFTHRFCDFFWKKAYSLCVRKRKEDNIWLLFDAIVSTGKINIGIRVSHYNAFNYKCMSYLGDLGEFKEKAINIKSVPEIYEAHKLSIDLFLKNLDRQNTDQLPFWQRRLD